MPGEPDAVYEAAEADDGVTVVWEIREAGGSFGGGGFGGGGFGGGGFGGGGGSGGGDVGESGGGGGGAPPDTGGRPDSVPVVDGSGAVVGEATVDPDTGEYTYVDPDPVVVDESSAGQPAPGHAAGGAISTMEIVPGGAGEVGEATGPKPFVVNPEAFTFTPEGDNWQSTGCVPVVFGYGSPFLTPLKITVGVRVGAPRVLRDGRPLHAREAQLDAANAAQAAATTVVGLLDAGAIEPSEIQPRFVGYMGGAILSTGLGYRVTGCFPR